MKSKYVLINETNVYPEMRCYILLVGISQREQRKRDVIALAAAKNPNIYFKQYSYDICEFMRKLAASIYENLSPHDAFLKFCEKNIRHISLSQAVGLASSR